MRKTVAILALALVVSLGLAVPAASAALADTKVVIIVGATHGATAGYRADADQAYAEAIKYTSNVVRVYSPYATWAKVKAAVAGASVVIYMGHGNGWPSPYTFDPNYTTKDGFGLNATYNAGDYNNKYYGEPSVATLDLAPGAIILLHHLCYASGNSEPGNPEPTVSVARQRADNYAAGFFKAGASAVIADGHSGAERYLHDLFTTHQTIEQMWRNAVERERQLRQLRLGPDARRDRQPGPDDADERLLPVGRDQHLGITTDKVVSGGMGNTGLQPGNLAGPGKETVGAPAAPVGGGPSAPDPGLPIVPGAPLQPVVEPAKLPADGASPAVDRDVEDPASAATPPPS